MNECVTPPPSGNDPDPAANHSLVVSTDFLTLLDEKLRRRNERLIEKLLAWGDLLDGAGWCVALCGAGGDFWLSERAERDLRRLGGEPVTWTQVNAALAGISADLIHRKSDGVIVWSGETPVMIVTGRDAGLTRREIEVMSWLREGKTGPEIAIILGCAIRTVEKHLANLYRKLGVKSRAEVILKTAKQVN